MTNTLFYMAAAAVILLIVISLLRSRKLREKYAALWVLVALLVVILALFPRLLSWLARLVGIQVPSNLLFMLAIILLLGVCLHLSLEISRLEDETRVLAENVAIINTQMRADFPEQLRRIEVISHAPDPTDCDRPGPESGDVLSSNA